MIAMSLTAARITEGWCPSLTIRMRVTPPHAAREPLCFSKNTLAAMDRGLISASSADFMSLLRRILRREWISPTG